MSVTAELLVGAQVKLAPTPYDASNRPLSGRAFAYSSSAPTIAKVDANGVVTGVLPGTAIITATADGKSATAVVKVFSAVNIVLTPSPASVNVGGTTQLAAALTDSAGNPLVGQTVVWTSSNPAVATVSNTGLVTGAAIGSCAITAAVGVASAQVTVTSSQAQDGSYADVIAAAAVEGITIRKFRDGRVATSDGVGVQRVPDVRGDGIGYPALVCIQNGGGNTIRPALDPVKKTIRTGGLGAQTALVSENWTGDASTDLSAGVWKVVGGAYRHVDSGSSIIGCQYGADVTRFACLQGAFGGFYGTNGVDATYYTPGNSYAMGTRLLQGTSLDCLLWWIPASGGVGVGQGGGSKNIRPWAATERLGVDGQIAILHDGSTNTWVAFPSGAYRDYFGGHPTGSQATPSIDSADFEYAYDIEFASQPGPLTKAAIKRFHAARPGMTAPVALIKHHIIEFADSRGAGNGASDQRTTSLAAQLATLLGPQYQVDNRGISGDQFDNLLIAPFLTQRIGTFYDDSRAWDVVLLGPMGVNSFNDTTNYPASGMTAATALARLDSFIAAVRAIYPDTTKVKIVVMGETTQAGAGIPQAAAYLTGLESRRVSGSIQGLVPHGRRYELQNANDARFWLDGLHNIDAGYGVSAYEDGETLRAMGAERTIQQLTVSPGFGVFIVHGNTQQLTVGLLDDQGNAVTVNPTTGSAYTFTYSSSDTSKATVNGSGLVTGVVVGSAYITVTTANGLIQQQVLVNVT